MPTSIAAKECQCRVPCPLRRVGACAHNTYVRTFQQAQDPLQGPSRTLPVQIRGRRGPGTVPTLRMPAIVSTLIRFSRLCCQNTGKDFEVEHGTTASCTETFACG